MMTFLFYLFGYESTKFTYVPSKHEKMNSTFAAVAKKAVTAEQIQLFYEKELITIFQNSRKSA